MNDWSMLKKLIWLHIVKGGGGIERTVKGAIVHVTNALARPAISVKCEVNPIQDLHGYDNPWPAGAMGNLLPLSGNMTKTNNGVSATLENGIITLSGTASGNAIIVFDLETAISILPENYKIALFNSANNSSVFFRTQDGSTSLHNFACSSVNRVVTSWTAQGAEHTTAVGVQVSDGVNVDGMSLKPMVVPLIESDPSAFYPYSNICPISGWTGAKVTRTGINVWDEEWEVGGIDNATGVNINNNSQIRSKNFIPIKPNTTYFGLALGQSSTSKFQTRFYDADKNYIGIGSPWNYNSSYITPSDAYYMRFCMQTNYGTTYNHDISINYPSTDHNYHPYQGNTYTIQLGDTVYGGTLDVVSGELIVNKRLIVLDGSIEWKESSISPSRAALGLKRYWIGLSISRLAKLNATTISSGMATVTGASWNVTSPGSLRTEITEKYEVAVYSSDYPNANAWRAHLSVEPMQVVYELATPIVYHLTPTQIDMLRGENNLWADAGDLTLTYYADGNASTSEALGILLGGTYNNPGGADDVSDDEALEILLGGS